MNRTRDRRAAAEDQVNDTPNKRAAATAERGRTAPQKHKLIVEVSDRLNEDIRSLAEEHGITVSDLVRRALTVYAHALRATTEDGRTLELVSESRDHTIQILMP